MGLIQASWKESMTVFDKCYKKYNIDKSILTEWNYIVIIKDDDKIKIRSNNTSGKYYKKYAPAQIKKRN